MLLPKFLCVIEISLFLIYDGSVFEARNVSAQNLPLSPDQSEAVSSIANQCPTNLSYLQPDMEQALQFVTSASFREAMLSSLQASIPEAIAQADGLARQMTFLKQKIARQERERVMRKKWHGEGLSDPSITAQALSTW